MARELAQEASPVPAGQEQATGEGRPPLGDDPGRLQQKAADLLARADVQIGGSRPWDLQVHDERLFARVFRQGSLGLGEAFMDGWWDVEDLDGFFYRVLRHRLDDGLGMRLPAIANAARHVVWNLQRGSRAFRVGEQHYDLGNEMYRRMLDRRMVYSCGYWKDAEDLDTAQEHKLELICRKLGLRPGLRLLDIGCGWGSLVRYAAKNHGVEAVGLTVSREQAEHARAAVRKLPVEIRYQDYRDLAGERFDRVVSVGMFEHVGRKNYRTFMRKAHEVLEQDGLHLLHTIGHPRSSVATDPWIERYIFPNSMLPSMAQITRAADDLFTVEDVHNIGAHYDPTLVAWWQNFSQAWDQVRSEVPDPDRFRRMWRYYLLSCAGAFRAGKLQVWQIVMAPDRSPEGGYVPVR